MNFKELVKYQDYMNKQKIKCACGHSILIPPHLDKIICDWCNHYVFRNKKAEFEYRLKESLNNRIEKEK